MTRTPFRHRIAGRLWLGMMALVAVVLVLLWLFQVVFLERTYTALRIQSAVRSADALAAELADATAGGASDLLESFVFRTGMDAEWFDADGRLVLSTSGSGGGMGGMMGQSSWAMMRAAVLPAALDGVPSSLKMTHPRLGEAFDVIGAPVRKDGAVVGALVAYLPLPAVAETAAVLKRQLLLISGVLTLVALLLSLFLARSFTRPIRRITDAARRMADGEFDAPVDVARRDEIGELADTLARMGRGLSRVEGLRREFLGNMSHDLRTPLTLIRGYAESLRDLEGTPPDVRRRQLDRIVAESERLGRLVDDLLDLSRLQSEAPRLDLRDVRLDALAARVADRFRERAEAVGMRLSLEAPEPATVRADEARLEQVLYNLVQNALQHARSGGAAAIRVRRSGGVVRCEVADDGPGIPEAERAAVWERYRKGTAGAGTGADAGGAGLGLAIVRSILIAHGASYGVESPPGEGATFWFSFPEAG